MELPEDLRYTSEHEWIRLNGDEGTIGITDFAQEQLGDVVYVELPEAGTRLVQGDTFGTIESVKAVSDLFAPVSGEVLERNEALQDAPELVNASPYGDGWLLKMRVEELAQVDALLDAASYKSGTVSA